MTKLDTIEKKLKAAIIFSGFPNCAPHVSVIIGAALKDPETFLKAIKELDESSKRKAEYELEEYCKKTSWRNDSPYWKKKLEEVL